MIHTRCQNLLALSLVLLAAPAVAQTQRPVFVETGACPGEGCTYGVWQASKGLSLRYFPSDTAETVASIPEGNLVCALTGEVHTIPGLFLVSRDHGQFTLGDTLFVLTYRGEGWFLIQYGSERFEENLEFSPWGGSSGSRCERGPECWGELQEPLEFRWWVRVDNLSGAVGWLIEEGAFDKLIPGARDPEFFAECRRRRDVR